MTPKMLKALNELYNTKETWVLLGNITSRVMIPLQAYEGSVPSVEELLKWGIQSFTLLWIGIILINIAQDFLKNYHPHIIKAVAFLCGFSPVDIINILLGIAAKGKLPIEMIIPLIHFNLFFHEWLMSLYNL